MKLKYLLSALIASAFVFAGCEDESKVNDGFDNVKVSETFLSIPEAGGSATITVNAEEDWYLVQNENWPDKIAFNKDANGKTIKAKHDVFGNLTNDEADIASRTSAWLAADKLQGSAGETTVTFSADATSGGREFELTLVCGTNRQFIRVRQGSLEAVTATCKEVNEGPDGKTYQVKGVCTAIANTTYGNWYLNDGTGEVYIYGTLDANGAEKNFTSLGLEIGDVVEVSGPKTTYGTTVELVNVTVLSIKKSLAKVLTESATYPKENNEFELRVAYKGGNFDSEIPDEYKSWISILGIKSVAGVPSKIEPSPADTAVVTVGLAANETGDRTGRINFSSGSSEVYYEFTQEGAIIDATAEVINAAEDGATQYRITGYVSKVANTKYGNLYIRDYTGEVYVYGTNDFATSGVEEGDIITVVGPKSSYKGAPQLVNVTVENRIDVQDIDLAGFKALDDNNNAWYRISGKVAKSTESGTKWDLDTYGNFALTDGTTEVYVYGVVAGWGGAKGKFGELGVKEGDNLTIVAYKTSYKGLIEAAGCFYVSHEAAEVGGGDEPAVTDITLTDSFLPTAYPTEETVVKAGEYDLAIYNVANYGNGIQMKKGGSYIYNSTAFGKIASIKLNVSEDKTWYKDNVKLYAGSSSNPSTEIALTSSDDTGSVYDLSAGDYSYIKIENPSNYAVYMGSIEIHLAK